MDLGEIIDSLRSEATTNADHNENEPPMVWTEADRLPTITLALSHYELYWLHWRLKVHLKSYTAVEWSEMKEALTCILTKTSTALKSQISSVESSSTPAGACSEEPSTAESRAELPQSSVQNVKPAQDGT